MAIDRTKDITPPIIMPGPDGAYTLTRITDPDYELKGSIHPIYVDPLPDGRFAVSDEFSNVEAIGNKPQVFVTYQTRLVKAASLSPEAIPQIVRRSPPVK